MSRLKIAERLSTQEPRLKIAERRRRLEDAPLVKGTILL
jgi:hypothetical protein